MEKYRLDVNEIKNLNDLKFLFNILEIKIGITEDRFKLAIEQEKEPRIIKLFRKLMTQLFKLNIKQKSQTRRLFKRTYNGEDTSFT